MPVEIRVCLWICMYNICKQLVNKPLRLYGQFSSCAILNHQNVFPLFYQETLLWQVDSNICEQIGDIHPEDTRKGMIIDTSISIDI